MSIPKYTPKTLSSCQITSEKDESSLHEALHKIFAKELGASITKAKAALPEYTELGFVNGLENPSEFHNVIRWLIKHGYSDEDIGKVAGGNILSVLKEAFRM
jgi:membrane dipeptidase